VCAISIDARRRVGLVDNAKLDAELARQRGSSSLHGA
jgi:hypothetical protein